MNKITLKEIRDLAPCYDPDIYLKEDWSGTLVDFLHIEAIPNKDRIWVAVRLMPRFLVDVFAIDCAFASSAYATSDAPASYAASCSYSAADAAADSAYADSASHSASNAYYSSAAASAYYASSTAAAAASSARNQQRENQIDALIMLLEGE